MQCVGDEAATYRRLACELANLADRLVVRRQPIRLYLFVVRRTEADRRVVTVGIEVVVVVVVEIVVDDGIVGIVIINIVIIVIVIVENRHRRCLIDASDDIVC